MYCTRSPTPASSAYRRAIAVVSSEEVARGKPAPDVYLEAARRLGVDPTDAAAVEDSEKGILSAKAAGMRVVVIPNPHFPPSAEALREADVILRDLGELTGEAVVRSAKSSDFAE